MGRGSGKGRVRDYYKPRGQRTHGEGARRRRRKKWPAGRVLPRTLRRAGAGDRRKRGFPRARNPAA